MSDPNWAEITGPPPSLSQSIIWLRHEASLKVIKSPLNGMTVFTADTGKFYVYHKGRPVEVTQTPQRVSPLRRWLRRAGWRK